MQLGGTTHSTVTRHLLALTGFLVLTCAIFAPLVADLNSGVLRGPTDGAQVIRSLWLFDQLGESPFTTDRDPYVGAPEGVPVASALNYAQPFQPSAVWLLSHGLGDAAAFNLFVLAGFVLTAFASYVLLNWLRFRPAAAFFGGAVVAFNPWMIERALEGHAAFIHAWPLILLIGALVALHGTRTGRHAALAGAAVGLSFLTAAYVGLLASLVAFTFLATTFVLTRVWTERLWVFSLASVMLGTAAIFLAPAGIAYLLEGDSVRAIAGHSAAELGSASVGSTLSFYVRPSAQHPVLGFLGTEPRLGTGNSEGVLYFGFTTIALAVFASVMLFRKRSPIRNRRAKFALTGAVVLAPVAFLFSLPTRVDLGVVEVPLPSALLAEFTSFYRVYARFGFVAGIAVALLAAAAVHILLERQRRPYLALAAATLVMFELFPGRVPVWSPAEREHDRWLTRQAPGIVANYPMPTDQYPALELALQEQYRQRFHGHPLFTLLGPGTGGTREEAIRLVGRYVTAPETPQLLAAEGVDYVFLHDDVFRAQGEVAPPVPAGFLLAETFDDIRLLVLDPNVVDVEIDALLEQQAAALAAVRGLTAPSLELGAGFGSPRGDGLQPLSGRGLIRLRSEGDVRRVLLLMQAESPATPRTLQVLDNSGRVLAEALVGTSATQLVLGPLPVRAPLTRLYLKAEPPASFGPDVLLTAPVVQPLADFSISLRERR